MFGQQTDDMTKQLLLGSMFGSNSDPFVPILKDRAADMSKDAHAARRTQGLKDAQVVTAYIGTLDIVAQPESVKTWQRILDGIADDIAGDKKS